MSMTDAIGRIQEIRSTIDALAGTSATSAASAPAASSASLGGDTGFAAALSAVSGSTAAPGGASNEALMASVEKYVGLPYVWGGNDPAVGLDCSSFVQNVFKDLGHSLPRVTWDQMNSGTKVDSLAQAQAGDLLFTHDGGHVSIYLGDGKVVDAPQPGKTIQVRDAWETDANITTIRRILPTETAAVQGASAPSTAAAITDMVASARAMQASLMGAAQ
ncbi:C40 family peptidase [Arthrobacter sp. zg-Y916]|uniref:C40 family peptidase n=1 Tax=Arthrobacter caoxuetaonis TaxID=2886935 RepID=A0A9X1MFI5_9MICC|nr:MULTISPECIES: C40 family peptidase [Arthrobacter]MCC3298275.1 C40 family peptidase [Arthrobacter caoxuetaonis]MCC9195037.1 C40 family peptidase [Arthrobacter sp. zg-Y916]USQ57707.1 C40 family peptidase [Arthrobacter caoxuetaonis]